MDRKSALREAERVRNFWEAKGVPVNVRVVADPIPDDLKDKVAHRSAYFWCVRTDLKNGMPRPPQPGPRLPMIRRKATPA